MSSLEVIAILNRAFIRVYRSFGQYLRDAVVVFDIGEQATFRDLIERQRHDANRLGTYIADQRGSVDTGGYPMDFGDLHFLNASRIVADWQLCQEQLVRELAADRAELGNSADPGVAMLDEIIAHERETLAKLRQIRSAAPTPVVSA